MQADGGRRGSGGGGSGVRDAAFAYDDVSDASSDENKTFEVARVLDHQVGPNGEPRYLVQWKGFPLLGDTDRWEPERRLAEGLSPGEAAHLRDSLEQVRTRKRSKPAVSAVVHVWETC